MSTLGFIGLAAHGVHAAGSIATVAERADTVFLSLPGGPELEAVCAALLPAMRAGHTLVDTSTSPWV